MAIGRIDALYVALGAGQEGFGRFFVETYTVGGGGGWGGGTDVLGEVGRVGGREGGRERRRVKVK